MHISISRLRIFPGRTGAPHMRKFGSRQSSRKDDRTSDRAKLANTIEGYSKVLVDLGLALTADLGISEHTIADAEFRLGLRLPEALASMLLLAGNASVFSSPDNHLFTPEEWTVEKGRLIFFESNEGQYLWAIDAGMDRAADPIVFRAVTDADMPLSWEKTETPCSEFLQVMLYWDAAFGASMPFCGTASVPHELVETLDRDWDFIGGLDGMRAYGKPGRAVCFVEWGKDNWTVFAGATDAAGLASVAADLDLTWE
jgi:hypothetical protein